MGRDESPQQVRMDKQKMRGLSPEACIGLTDPQSVRSYWAPHLCTCISALLEVLFKCTILKFFLTWNEGLHIFTQHQALKMMEPVLP